MARREAACVLADREAGRRDAGSLRFARFRPPCCRGGRILGQHVACVIAAEGRLPALGDRPRVRALTPSLSKGLEFDLVVLLDPQEYGEGVEGAVDRYVAMTRATQRLAVLTTP